MNEIVLLSKFLMAGFALHLAYTGLRQRGYARYKLWLSLFGIVAGTCLAIALLTRLID